MSQLNKKTEEIFKQIGEFGPYQLLIFILVGVIAFEPALVAYSFSFYGATPNHRCKIPNYDNDTYEIQSEYHRQLIEKYIPKSKSGSFKTEYENCKINEFYKNTSNSSLINCDQWVYSKKYFRNTLTSDWNLVCKNAPKRSLFSTLYFSGSYGVLLSGILSDKLGRKTTAYLFVICNAILNIGLFLVMTIDIGNQNLREILFGILRLLIGISANVYATAVVIAIEIVGPKKRVAAANTIYYLYIIGEFVVLSLVYLIPDYKTMYGYIVAILTFIALYFWVVPESPRWLMAKKRKKEAYKIFQKIAKSNKKSFYLLDDADDLSSIQDVDIETEEKHYTIIQTLKIIFKSKTVFIRSSVILLNWLANTFVYYGISYNTSDLAGDPYLNFGISALVELLAIIVSHYVLERFGRKIPYSIMMATTGFCFISILFIPKKLGLLVTSLTLVSKFAVSFSYNTIYIITAESHPTVIRNSSLAICQTFSRIGTVISPNIQLLGDIFWYPLPSVIYGSISSISVILFVIFMPETRNQKLPDTINEFIKDD